MKAVRDEPIVWTMGPCPRCGARMEFRDATPRVSSWVQDDRSTLVEGNVSMTRGVPEGDTLIVCFECTAVLIIDRVGEPEPGQPPHYGATFINEMTDESSFIARVMGQLTFEFYGAMVANAAMRELVTLAFAGWDKPRFRRFPDGWVVTGREADYLRAFATNSAAAKLAELAVDRVRRRSAHHRAPTFLMLYAMLEALTVHEQMQDLPGWKGEPIEWVGEMQLEGLPGVRRTREASGVENSPGGDA